MFLDDNIPGSGADADDNIPDSGTESDEIKSDSSSEPDNIKPDSGNEANETFPILDFQLNQIDRFADILSIIGLHLSFVATDKVDQTYFLRQEQQLSSEEEAAISYDIAKTVALTNWIFLTGGTLFLETSCDRLLMLEDTLPENPSLAEKERFSGRKMVTTGNLFKVIGFLLAASGFERIADSFQKESESSES